MAQLPGSLRHSPSFAFAGRSRELDVLRALVPQAPGEGRRVALVSGEPGAGKTRLVRELAADLAESGSAVLYGACDSAVRAPYRPFVEALDPLLRRDDATPLPPHLAPIAGGAAPAPAPADPDTERHRLHLAVAELLAAASRRSPLLLVLEDVHWADGPSLLLLRHLVRASGDVRMLVLVTYREVEAAAPDVTGALVEIGRSEGVTRLRLAGLSSAELGEFARLNGGAEPSASLVASLAELTDGNAFLVTEVWRELVEAGSLDAAGGLLRLAHPAASLGTPEAVRAVVGQRVERLAPETAAVLEIAAVAGAEFDLSTLRAAAAVEEGVLLDAIDEAERHGLIGELPAGGLAYRFSHELVRLAVVDRLSAPRRAEIHLRVAEALARADPAAEAGGRLALLAHHFAAAAPLGGTDRAVAYNLLAASAAEAALAFDEAVEQLRTALSLGIAAPAERAEAWLELGNVSHRAGRAVDALEAFRETAELARVLDDSELLARAAIGFEEACWRPAIHDAGSVELLEEAAAALGSDDSELLVRVLGGLARALEYRADPIGAARARDESIAMARRRGDLRGLALTLAGSWWSHGTSSAEEVDSMLTEALELGERLGDAEICAEALGWLVPSAVVLCDHDSARRALAQLLEVARRQNQPFHLHVAEHYASSLALSDGDLPAAEAAAQRSNEWSRLLTGRDASGVYGIQLFSVRREQGRLGELAPVVRVLSARADGAWRPGLAALLAELEMTAEASRELRRTVLDELEQQRHSLWLTSLTYLADAAAALSDALAAERLYPELAPYEGTNVVVGHLVSCYGAADRYLGMLAAVVGEWDAAERHFEAAAALNRQLGARTWLAHTHFEHARAIRARGRASESARADLLVAEASALAEGCGLSGLVRRIGTASAGARARRPATLPASLTGREAEVLRLLARGLSNRDIGRSLFISEHTTASHVRSILRKTGCANRTEAAAYAHRRGLVDG